MDVNCSNPVESHLRGPPVQKTLTTILFQDSGCVGSVSVVDADIAVGMEEISINLKTQLGRELKERKFGHCDFVIMIRSVAWSDPME